MELLNTRALEYSVGCCEAANQPAERKERGPDQKYGKAWRIIPGVVNVLANIENGPEQEWARSEILQNLGSLVGDGRQFLTIDRIGKLIEPIPSDDSRSKKMPFRISIRLPSTKTRGMVVNLASGGANIQ